MTWMGTCGGCGHVAGCGGMWQGVGACGRVLVNVAGVGAGCGGMWQGSGNVVRGEAYGMDGNMWWGWGHVVGTFEARLRVPSIHLFHQVSVYRCARG